MDVRGLRLLLVTTATAVSTGVLAAPAAAVVPSPAPAASVAVRTTLLPGLPGATGSAQATGINREGTTVGWATAANGVVHAVVWRGTRITDLGQRHPEDRSSAAAVNDQGLVVGTSAGQAALWQSGRRHLLPQPPDPVDGFVFSCAATSVDRTGRIGGYCNVDVNSSVVSMAVRWVDRRPVRAWYPGTIFGLSPSGAVRVGMVDVEFDGDTYAYLRDPQGQRRLPELVPGSADSRALGANDAGLVVGQSAGHAVVWRHGEVRPLAVTLPGGTGTATAVNRWGNVVGAQHGPDYTFATMWKNGVPFRLGGFSRATALNDVGQVAGWITEDRATTTAVRWTVTGTP